MLAFPELHNYAHQDTLLSRYGAKPFRPPRLELEVFYLCSFGKRPPFCGAQLAAQRRAPAGARHMLPMGSTFFVFILSMSKGNGNSFMTQSELAAPADGRLGRDLCANICQTG